MPHINVTKKLDKSKIKISEERKAAMRKIVDSYSEDFDVKMTVIQELIPLGSKAVAALSRSLSTTNCIEGVMSQLGSYNAPSKRVA